MHGDAEALPGDRWRVLVHKDRFQEVDLHGKGVCRIKVVPEVALDDGAERCKIHGSVEAGTLGTLVGTQQFVAYQAFPTPGDGDSASPRLSDFDSMRRMIIGRHEAPEAPLGFAEAYAPPDYFLVAYRTYPPD
jgi:hypothetical protein